MTALSATDTRELFGALERVTTDTEALTVERIVSVEAMQALRSEWEHLERRTRRPVLFQSAAWCINAARHFERAADGSEPLVIAVRQDGHLVGIAPLRVVRRGPIRLAIEIGAPFGQYGDFLVADDVDAEAVVRKVLDALYSGPGVDGLLLRRMRADSPVRSALQSRGFVVGEPDAAPYVDLAAYDSFEALQKTLSVKTRKNMRNQRNRLSRNGVLVEHRVFCRTELGKAIEIGFESRLRALEERGLASTAFMDGGFRDFVTALPDADGIEIIGMGLFAGDVPLSVQWGFVHQGRYYAYITARNPDYDEVSPGKLHLEDVMRALKERGIVTADLLAPAVPYKFIWAEKSCEVADVAVPFSLFGRLWLDGWNNRLRPWLRDTFMKMPAGLRQLVARRMLRRAPAKAPEPAEG
jgi:CelD/BcsL family acetyltransferase involved in cellulose biosynthesis